MTVGFQGSLFCCEDESTFPARTQQEFTFFISPYATIRNSPLLRCQLTARVNLRCVMLCISALMDPESKRKNFSAARGRNLTDIYCILNHNAPLDICISTLTYPEFSAARGRNLFRNVSNCPFYWLLSFVIEFVTQPLS